EPVTLISRERLPAYSPCALPYLISKELPHKHITRIKDNFYKEMDIKTVLGNPVCKIMTKKNTVTLCNGRSYKYDKLLIATGSVPIIPPIQPQITAQRQIKGVFAVDTLEGTKRIAQYITKNTQRQRSPALSGKVKKAVVIGAGFTGIETALALVKQGVETTIVEMLDRILPRMLDSEVASIAQQKLKDAGIKFNLNSQVVTINTSPQRQHSVKDTKVSGITLASGEEIDCQIVIMAIGVRPNMEFIKDSGININKGILVDETMQTSISDIYAAGDVAETVDYLTGQRVVSAIWMNAVEQGRVAGLNMAGVRTAYDGADSINVLNIPDISVGTPCLPLRGGRQALRLRNDYPVVSMGLISSDHVILSEAKNLNETITHRTEQSYRKLFLKDNSIIGFE
ncbi:MAG: NAD(P)/FAD-dependent oxidoreductase, partial [Planctomycetes bacterium]|nr:NAD(P)/FAD-dependent oxidoreductase [Planctomycetota bacterium]